MIVLMVRVPRWQGLMDLEDEALDDFVPAAVVQQFAEAAARGVAKAINLHGRA